MGYGDFKDLAKGTAADKVIRDKAFNITNNSKYDEHQRGLDSTGSGVATFANKLANNEIKQNLQLAE